MQRMSKKHYYDIALILILLIVALSVFIIMRACARESEYVVVRVDGEEVCRYLLSEEGEYSLNGGSNILVISDGKAYVSSADCPDKVCVRTGKISLSGERIVCLPNRVEIFVEGEARK